MLRVMYFEQLRRIGPFLIALCAMAAALPVLSCSGLLAGGVASESFAVLEAAGRVSMYYPMLSCAVGLIIGPAGWQTDQEHGHVYALSLPIPRWHYALLRLTTGVLLVLPVVAALSLSALLTSALVALPPGLQTYPLPLSLRFAATSLVTFSTMFMLASASSRSFLIGAGVLFAAFVADSWFAASNQLDYSVIAELLFGTRSPFSFFMGVWTLIDV